MFRSSVMVPDSLHSVKRRKHSKSCHDLELAWTAPIVELAQDCGESDSENAPVITQSREDAEVRQICKRRAGQRGNWTVEFIL